MTDFVLFPDYDDLHRIYRLHDLQHQRTLGDLLNAALEVAEARGEAEAAKRIARQLLDLGQSDEVVFKATGLRSSDLK